jgi:hypothetical protein
MRLSPIYILYWYYQVSQFPNQVFSTDQMAYVSIDDPDYQSWTQGGLIADQFTTGSELTSLLLSNWLPFYLPRGVEVSSSTNPLLSGTYAVQDADTARISSIATGIASGKGLPGGGSTFWYAHINDQLHSFTQEEFLNFAKSIENWMYNLRIAIRTISQQNVGSIPVQPVNIDPPVNA